MSSCQRSVAVVGGGPAGLRAAEVAVESGAQVTLYDAKPSVGRKFLVAGKSGLNLTNAAQRDDFLAQYSGNDLPENRWKQYFQGFDNDALRQWAASLGVDTFVAANGKVFPQTKKAAPLLRSWLSRLRELGVRFEMNHRWLDVRVDSGVELTVRHDAKVFSLRYDAVILALGGASWPQTGSDGGWVDVLQKRGISIEPLQSANCGWECAWSQATLARAEGQPLHNLTVSARGRVLTGELMVTRYGFEGTPLYTLGPELRRLPEPYIEIDFKPTFTAEHMIHKMESARRHFFKEARLRWKLSDAACAIIEQCYGTFDNAEALAHVTKCCRVVLIRPRPLVEAISTAGGVAWSALNHTLMLNALPGVYCAGEMLDWEAPTGGYLLQGCFVTGTVAGKAAAGAF